MCSSPLLVRFGQAATALLLSLTTISSSGGAESPDAGPLLAYVGSYSLPQPFLLGGQLALAPGNGRGISLFTVDRTTGALALREVHEQTTSPTCLVLNPAGTCLYSANATDLVAGDAEHPSGSISAFAIDRANGHLTLLDTVASGGTGPTYVSVHPSGRFLLVANYFGGSVAVLPIRADGSLGQATDVKKSAGKVGPAAATHAPPGSFAISGHEVPHAHMIQADASGHFVLSAELGLDQILIWKFDDQTGTLAPNDPPFVSFPPGDGPRHFAFHPKGHWLYSLQEEGSTVVLLDYDPASGRLAPRQTLSSLPPGFAGTSSASEILVSPDGRHVYAANRLHDSISVFAVGETGLLTFQGETWTHGDFPRTFNFDPSGKLLYSCNQRADSLTAFQVDQGSGALKFTGQFTPVGSPAIIVFLDLGKPAK